MKRGPGPVVWRLPPRTFGPSVLWCDGSALFDDAFEAIELADLVVHGPLHHRAHEPLETAQVGVEMEADASAAVAGNKLQLRRRSLLGEPLKRLAQILVCRARIDRAKA
jgi:hypothetical protein